MHLERKILVILVLLKFQHNSRRGKARRGVARRGEARQGKDKLKKENKMQTAQFKYTTKYSKEVVDEILLVKSKYGLTAENLVKQALTKGSALKGLFEWDDKECGRLHREQQARLIINEIKIIIEDKEIYAFENISIETENVSAREYFDTIEIQDDSDKSEQVATRAYEQILYWKSKFEIYVVNKRGFSTILKGISELEEAMK